MDFDEVAQQASTTPTPTGIAILSTCAGILVALIAGVVQLRQARISQQNVEHEVTPHRDTTDVSLREEINRLQRTVERIDEKLDAARERLIQVETRQQNAAFNRRATDRQD